MSLRILVVDDYVDSATALSLFLRTHGYDAKFATSVDDALAMLAQGHPHCVIFDMEMPNKNGLVLANEMRNRYALDVCLICVTALDLPHRLVSEVMEVADHVFRKPVDSEKLKRILDTLEANRRTQV